MAWVVSMSCLQLLCEIYFFFSHWCSLLSRCVTICELSESQLPPRKVISLNAIQCHRHCSGPSQIIDWSSQH